MARYCCAIGTFSLVVAGSSALAGSTIPDPVFWCWSPPDFETASNDHFLETVLWNGNYCPTCYSSSVPMGGWTIASAGLHAGEGCASDASALSGPVAIILHSFGIAMGNPDDTSHTKDLTSLSRHWCDALPDTELTTASGGYWSSLVGDCWGQGDIINTEIDWWWATPWTSAGRTECNEFMEEFIDAYIDDSGPAPVRFFFDVERGIPAVEGGSTYPTEDNCSGMIDIQRSAALQAFHEARSDDRWGTTSPATDGEPVFDGMTMYELYDDASGPAYDECEGWQYESGSVSNTDWVIWYSNLSSKIKDEAVREGLTAAVEAARDGANPPWPDVLTSNYNSRNVDDEEGMDWISDGGVGAKSWWAGFHPTSTTDLQSPKFYSVHEDHAESSDPDDRWDASIIVHRHNLDLLIDSLGNGESPSEIVPWIQNVDVKDDVTGVLVDKDDVRRLVSLLRSRGIKEFILWGNSGQIAEQEEVGLVDPDEWDDMADIQEQVWMYDLDSHTVDYGSTSQSSGQIETALALRDGRLATIDSDEVGAGNLMQIELVFDGGDSEANDLMFSVEADLASGSGSNVGITALIHDGNSSWDAMTVEYTTTTDVGIDDRRLFVFKSEPMGGDDYVDMNGQATIQLYFTNLIAHGDYTVRIDSVQLIEAD